MRLFAELIVKVGIPLFVLVAIGFVVISFLIAIQPARAAMEHEEIVARLAAGLPVPGLRYATCRPHHRLKRHCTDRRTR